MMNDANPTAGPARRRPISALDIERDDARPRLPGTSAYRPGCIAGWGPKLG